MTDLITFDDQQVRAAVIKVSNPPGNTRLLRRSERHLYLIEVKNEDMKELTPVSTEETVDLEEESATQINH